jgi:pimeloyl-ACP methyl ester carboxylesterase
MSETLGSAAALHVGSSSMSFYFRYCFFPAEGAAPYQRALQNVDMHMFDTGHFTLETHGEEIASRIEKFLQKRKLAS